MVGLHGQDVAGVVLHGRHRAGRRAVPGVLMQYNIQLGRAILTTPQTWLHDFGKYKGHFKNHATSIPAYRLHHFEPSLGGSIWPNPAVLSIVSILKLDIT